MTGPAGKAMGLRDAGKAQRRQALLDAAREIIREGETTGFAMRALAQRAGVGEVTPYNLFGSKRGVLAAIIDEELHSYQEEFARSPSMDALSDLFKFVTVSVDMYRRDPPLYRVVLRDLMLTGDPSLRSVFSVPQGIFFQGLVEDAVQAGLIAEAVEPRLSARSLGRLFTSCVGDWLWESISLESLEANIGLGFAMILRGIALPGAAERCDALMLQYQRDVIRHSRKSTRATANLTPAASLPEHLKK